MARLLAAFAFVSSYIVAAGLASDTGLLSVFRRWDAGYQPVMNVTQARPAHGVNLFKRQYCDSGYGYCSGSFVVILTMRKFEPIF